MQEIIGARIEASEPGSLGIVRNTRYIRCFWPNLEQPTALFADGSFGIEVQGPPTPRNVIFPKGTVALNTVASDSEVVKMVAGRPELNHLKWRITQVSTKLDCFFVQENDTIVVDNLTREDAEQIAETTKGGR